MSGELGITEPFVHIFLTLSKVGTFNDDGSFITAARFPLIHETFYDSS